MYLKYVFVNDFIITMENAKKGSEMGDAVYFYYRQFIGTFGGVIAQPQPGTRFYIFVSNAFTVILNQWMENKYE